MDNRTVACIAIAGSLALATLPGCGDRLPTAPRRAAPPPTPPSQTVRVTAVQPNAGPSSGSIVVRILGSGFEPGAIVTLGAPAAGVEVVDSRTIEATVGPHPVGTVDVVVTNLNTQSGTLRRGFTYAVFPRATISGVSPSIGTTAGGTPVVISGSQFRPGAKVTFGGIETVPFLHDGSLYLATPPHAAGAVDVAVTNAAAESHTLVNGYSYAPPESFDFNGTWVGSAGAEYELHIAVTIENDFVTSVRCDGSDPLTFTAPPVVRNGAFSFSGAGGAMTGRIVSPSGALGTIDIGPCRNMEWFALKQELP
jgi:IPT/TIG domain-containing protein